MQHRYFLAVTLANDNIAYDIANQIQANDKHYPPSFNWDPISKYHITIGIMDQLANLDDLVSAIEDGGLYDISAPHITLGEAVLFRNAKTAGVIKINDLDNNLHAAHEAVTESLLKHGFIKSSSTLAYSLDNYSPHITIAWAQNSDISEEVIEMFSEDFSNISDQEYPMIVDTISILHSNPEKTGYIIDYEFHLTTCTEEDEQICEYEHEALEECNIAKAVHTIYYNEETNSYICSANEFTDCIG